MVRQHLRPESLKLSFHVVDELGTSASTVLWVHVDYVADAIHGAAIVRAIVEEPSGVGHQFPLLPSCVAYEGAKGLHLVICLCIDVERYLILFPSDLFVVRSDKGDCLWVTLAELFSVESHVGAVYAVMIPLITVTEPLVPPGVILAKATVTVMPGFNTL